MIQHLGSLEILDLLSLTKQFNGHTMGAGTQFSLNRNDLSHLQVSRPIILISIKFGFVEITKSEPLTSLYCIPVYSHNNCQEQNLTDEKKCL